MAQDEGLILISFSRGKSTIKDRTEKLLKYTFTKDANNKISTCTVMNELLTDLWKKSPDDPLNIYYNTGSVVVGSTDPDNSAAFEINSTEKGFLPPRLTTDQRLAISSPATGLLVFDTDENTYYFWDGSAWVLLGGQDNIVFY